MYDLLLPSVMDSVDERSALREQNQRLHEMTAGSGQAEANVLSEEADIERSLLEGGSSLHTIDELMESDWMGGKPSPKEGAPPAAFDDTDEEDEKKMQSSSSDIDETELMTIFEIRDELRGRLGLGLSDAHELTVYLSELAGANIDNIGGGYQALSVSDADEFVAAVDANGGGIEEKFCRRIFGSLRHAAMQREAKEKRQREREAKQAVKAYAAERQASVGPVASLSVSDGSTRLPSSAAIGGGRWRNVIKNELPMNVAAWSIGDVNKWLEELGLGEYSERFEKSALIGERLLVATHTDLQKAVSILTSPHPHPILISSSLILTSSSPRLGTGSDCSWTSEANDEGTESTSVQAEAQYFATDRHT